MDLDHFFGYPLMTTFEVGLNRGGREAIGVTPKSSKTMQNSLQLQQSRTAQKNTHTHIYIDQPAIFFFEVYL
jgi:hypothetical protein